jgi:hypothetical protein
MSLPTQGRESISIAIAARSDYCQIVAYRKHQIGLSVNPEMRPEMAATPDRSGWREC